MLKYEGVRIDVGRGRPHLAADLSIEAGTRTMLVGPNGSGKTSLLDAAIGARQLRSGLVRLDSARPVAYAVQDALSGLLPWLTVWDNILLPSRLTAQEQSAMVDGETFLAALGIASLRQAMPTRLSGGERQMINLIRAACTPADSVLLDEPFGALHSGTRALAIQEIIPRFGGRTVLVVSHEPADLQLGFDRHLLIHDDGLADISAAEALRFLEAST